MKCKIIPIPVEKSRILKNPITGHFFYYKNPQEKGGGEFQPILPVLVSDEEIKEGDSIWHPNYDDLILSSHPNIEKATEHKKVVTTQTEELYEYLASGELKFDTWYEFEEVTGKNNLGETRQDLFTPLRFVEREPDLSGLEIKTLNPVVIGNGGAGKQPIVTEDAEKHLKSIKAIIEEFSAICDLQGKDWTEAEYVIHNDAKQAYEWLVNKLND